MSRILERFEEEQVQGKKIPPFRSGDTVRVHIRIREGGKERVQPFEGIVLNRTGRGHRATFTLRRVSFGVGVERIFPLYSPWVERIEVIQRGKVRKSRIYYLRGRRGRSAQIKREDEKQGASQIHESEQEPKSNQADPPPDTSAETDASSASGQPLS